MQRTVPGRFGDDAPVKREFRFVISIIGLVFFFVFEMPASDNSFASHPLAPLNSRPSGARSGFRRISHEQSGVKFINELATARSLKNQVLLNGSGVACGDVNGDQWPDLFFTKLDGPNELYLNQGAWRFQKKTATGGIDLISADSTGCALADLDGDSDLDLMVNTIGRGTFVFHNEGEATFTHVETLASQSPAMGAMSLSLADIDLDGDLDAYVVNYRPTTVRDEPGTRFRIKEKQGQLAIALVDGRSTAEPDLVGRFTYSPSGKVIENGQPDQLYLNDGNGRFELAENRFVDASYRPVEPLYDWGLSAMFHDINGDLVPDLYVCNDFDSPDRIWINDGQGYFVERTASLVRSISKFSMGVDFGDINGDGFDDFLVLDMLSPDHARRHIQTGEVSFPQVIMGNDDRLLQYSRNTLQVNRGDGTFAEIGRMALVNASDWSWTPIFMDADLDGRLDIFVTNGHGRDAMHADISKEIDRQRIQNKWSRKQILESRKMFPVLATPNLAFRNKGNLCFENVSDAWGFDLETVSHGMAMADLDLDGDQDLVINNLNRPASLLENLCLAPRLAVKLRGRQSHTHGVGARIVAQTRSGRIQTRTVKAAGRYLSSDAPIITLAGLDGVSELSVHWPSGQTSQVSNPQPGFLFDIAEPVSTALSRQEPKKGDRLPSPAPWFTALTLPAQARHQENSFEDFQRQPLLYRRLSQPGPSVAWFDWDKDGWDDLYLSQARGAPLQVYRNAHDDSFKPVLAPPFNRPTPRDQTAILTWRTPSQGWLAFAGTSNWEDGISSGGTALLYAEKNRSRPLPLPGINPNTSSLSLGFVGHEERTVLFAGSRCLAGHYPRSTSSYLLQGIGSEFSTYQTLEKAGLVTGSIFSDIDNDGDQDLVISREWDTPAIYINENGTFEDRTAEFGLTRMPGLWTCLTAGDFDEDGRMDYVLGNWGRNVEWSRAIAQGEEIRLYYGDYDANGLTDMMLAGRESITSPFKPMVSRDVATQGVRNWQQLFPSSESYATASIADLVGEGSDYRRVRELRSIVLLNRGASFDARPLPLEAQYAPILSLAALDIDGDSHLDLVAAQNYFANANYIGRFDAGHCLIMRGDGQGRFSSLSPQENGMHLLGEPRSIATGDLNRDGRPDIAIGVNAAPLRVYKNNRSKPQTTVTLIHSSDGSLALGAKLRRASGGVLYEMNRGQHSPAIPIALSEAETHFDFWAPGQTDPTRLAIPKGFKNLEVSAKGCRGLP